MQVNGGTVMTAKKTQKSDFIPISEIFETNGFKRNYPLIMQENNGVNSEIGKIITQELISKAITGTNLFKQNIKNGGRPKKILPSKEELEGFKNEHMDNEELEHGIRKEHGWKGYAIKKLKLLEKYGSISYQTINRIMEGKR